MSQSEGPSSRPKSPRSTSGLGRGRGKTGEGRPGLRPAPQRSLVRSDSRSESTRGIASGSPAPPASSQQPPPPPAENASPSQLSLLEVQLSLLSTKVTALEEAKDKVEFLQSTLKEVEKRANFLQKANETLTAKVAKLEEEQSKKADDQGSGDNNADILDGFSVRLNRLEASVSSLASKPPQSQEAAGNGEKGEGEEAPPRRAMQRAMSLAEAGDETVEEVKAKLALDNGDIMLALERVMSLEHTMRGLASTVEAQGKTLATVTSSSSPPGQPPPPPGPPPPSLDVVIEREVKRLWASVQRGDLDVQKLARLVTSEISAGKYSQSQATEIVRRVRLLDAAASPSDGAGELKSDKQPLKFRPSRADKDDNDSDLDLAGDDDEGSGGGSKPLPLPVAPKRRSSLSSGGPGALAEPDVPFLVRFFTAIPTEVLSKIGIDKAGHVVLLPLDAKPSTGQPGNWAQGLQPGDRIVSVNHLKVEPLAFKVARRSLLGGSAASNREKREKAKVKTVCDQIRKVEVAAADGGYTISFVRPSDPTKVSTPATAAAAAAAAHGGSGHPPASGDKSPGVPAAAAKRKPRKSIFSGFISSSSYKSDALSEENIGGGNETPATAGAAGAQQADEVPAEARSRNYLPLDAKDGKDNSDPVALLASARSALADTSSNKAHSWEASFDGLTALRRVAVRAPQHLNEEVIADCAKELESCCRSIRPALAKNALLCVAALFVACRSNDSIFGTSNPKNSSIADKSASICLDRCASNQAPMVRQAAKLVLEEATHQGVPLAVLERLFLALVAKTSTAKHKDVCAEAAVHANLACKSAIQQAPNFAATSSWKHHLLNNSLGSHLYAAVNVQDAVGQEAAQSCCATLATSLGGSVDWAAAIAAAPGLSVAAREELTAVQPPPPPPTSPNPPPPPPREPSAASAATGSSKSEAPTSGLSSKDEVFVQKEAGSLWSEVESGTMPMSEVADLVRENVKEGDYTQQQADAILSTLKARHEKETTPKRKDSDSSSSSSSDSSGSDSDDKLIGSINSANNGNANDERNDDDDDGNDNGTIALSGAEEKQVVSEVEELWSEVKSGGISMNEVAELVNGGVDEGDYSNSQGHEILRRIAALAKEANIE